VEKTVSFVAGRFYTLWYIHIKTMLIISSLSHTLVLDLFHFTLCLMLPLICCLYQLCNAASTWQYFLQSSLSPIQYSVRPLCVSEPVDYRKCSLSLSTLIILVDLFPVINTYWFVCPGDRNMHFVFSHVLLWLQYSFILKNPSIFHCLLVSLWPCFNRLFVLLDFRNHFGTGYRGSSISIMKHLVK
jgi:hypothetical protein